MSVFDDLPDPFPFEASVSKRPVAFVLQPDRAHRYIVGFIALFRIVIGVPVAIAVALVLAVSGLQAYAMPARSRPSPH